MEQLLQRTESKNRNYYEGEEKLTGKILFDVSKLVDDLNVIAKAEPQVFILLVGKDISHRAKQIKRQWIDFHVRWIVDK